MRGILTARHEPGMSCRNLISCGSANMIASQPWVTNAAMRGLEAAPHRKSTMTQKSHLPRKGETLAGKYQVEEVLGAGGMGVVVAARHMALRQRVALKFLLPVAIQQPGAAARFLREAQASVAIQSEHVARVLDVGTLENGAPYMVMEHLSGVDLARHLERLGPLAVDDAVDFVLQACEALAEAHKLGIVHRDLKPANLFLTRRAEGSALVKVLDFGLSKMTAVEGTPEASLTAANVVAGSPHYMSPEQVRSLKHVDARTDVWALGVILYELLTGKPPFDGPTVTAIWAAVVADAPRPLRDFRPDLPPGLETLVLTCLEKDPTHRVASVGHLAVGLAPFAPKRSEPLIEHICRLQAVPEPSIDEEKVQTVRRQVVPDPIPRTLPEAPILAEGASEPTEWATGPFAGIGGRKRVWIGGAVAAMVLTAVVVGSVLLRGNGDSAMASSTTSPVGADSSPSTLLPVASAAEIYPSTAPTVSGTASLTGASSVAVASSTGAASSNTAGSPSGVPAPSVAPSTVPKSAVPSTIAPKSTGPSAASTPTTATTAPKKKPNPLDLNR